jgi:DNA polymerase-1
MNRMIQGSGARMTKKAMRDAWQAGIVPLLQMHDALSLSTAQPSDAVRLKEIMENAHPVSVPMLVDMKVGSTWANVETFIST